jgi:hypothetical protein
MSQVLTFLIVAAITAIAVHAYQKWSEKQAAIRAAVKWMAELVDKGMRIKLICGDASGVILDSHEELLGFFPETTLLEPRAVRTYRGGYAGPSIRVAKGVSFRFGGYRGSSESHDEMRSIDRGTLVLTSQRLMFIGAGRTSSVALEKIIRVEGFNYTLQLHRDGKQRVEYFRFSKGIEMHYQCDAKSLSVTPPYGQVVKLAVTQAIKYQLHPELVGLQFSSITPPPAVEPFVETA